MLSTSYSVEYKDCKKKNYQTVEQIQKPSCVVIDQRRNHLQSVSFRRRTKVVKYSIRGNRLNSLSIISYRFFEHQLDLCISSFSPIFNCSRYIIQSLSFQIRLFLLNQACTTVTCDRQFGVPGVRTEGHELALRSTNCAGLFRTKAVCDTDKGWPARRLLISFHRKRFSIYPVHIYIYIYFQS